MDRRVPACSRNGCTEAATTCLPTYNASHVPFRDASGPSLGCITPARQTSRAERSHPAGLSPDEVEAVELLRQADPLYTLAALLLLPDPRLAR
jgi:hypothetical protein